jgi:pyruvate oxidase
MDRDKVVNDNPPITQTVGDMILSQLSAWGVKHMYGVAGDAILPLLDSVRKQDAIQYFSVRYESAAAFMASAEGKCTTRIGVCIGTSGPGLVNMLNGIADASADHVPMLVITGQVETKKVGTEAKQYVEQQQMISPLAIYSASILHPEAAGDIIQKAIIEAISKRGVAHVSVPKDIFSAVCTETIKNPIGLLRNEKNKDLHQLDQALMHLISAKKPMLYLGEGARGTREQCTKLAELLGAGILETFGAKGTIPFDYPLFVGGIGKGGTLEGSSLLKQSDCVLVIGANWWPKGFVPEDTKIIQIDTSGANIEAHKEVTNGLVGDASEVMSDLIDRISKQKAGENSSSKAAWRTQIQETKEKMVSMLDSERSQITNPIAPQRLISAIDQIANDDAIMAIDTGDHTIWFNRIFRARNQQVLYSGKWRTMGFGLPAAISAQINYPTKQVIAIVGDGGFAMTMMELSTVVKYKLPIIVIVSNNHSLAMEKNKMLVEGNQPYGIDLINPDFARLAEAFGAKGFKVIEDAELLPTLEKAMALWEPVVIDVQTSDIMTPLAGMH